MHWIAPSEKDTVGNTLEKRLWPAADQFQANSGLCAAQYSQRVLSLIFLRFTEVRFSKQRASLETASASELTIHGLEKTDKTGRLRRMNLAVHDLDGDICHGEHVNSYCEVAASDAEILET